MQVQLTLDSALPLPPRPRRRIPTLWAIVSYWAPLGVFEFLETDQPQCFGCSVVVDILGGPLRDRWNSSSRRLDKAHLVDHALNGLDGPQNMVALCYPCHRAMPKFSYGPDAIEWVRSGGRMTWDELPKPDAQLAPCARGGGSHAVADEPKCREALERVRAGWKPLFSPEYEAAVG
jgi:hypothetical protein